MLTPKLVRYSEALQNWQNGKVDHQVTCHGVSVGLRPRTFCGSRRDPVYLPKGKHDMPVQ